MCGAGNRACKTAGIISCRNGPRIFLCIELDIDLNVLRLQTEHVGDHLREHSAMALPRRRRGDNHAHAAKRIDGDGCAADCAVLRSGLGARFRR